MKLDKPEKYPWNPPKSLEEIDISDIRGFPQIDSKIKNLVKSLRSIGLITMGSCEGHLNDERRYSFPWVTCYGLGEYRDMYDLLLVYNHSRPMHLRWTINRIALQPVVPAFNKEGLRKLQDSANDLAKFLFEKYYGPDGI